MPTLYSLQGTQNVIYIHGKLEESETIQLPTEWNSLVDLQSIVVQLTPVGKHQTLYVKSINGLLITIDAGTNNVTDINCHYVIYATRIN